MGRRKGRTRFSVYVTPAAKKEMKKLPGSVRQRVRRAVDGLADEPRPAKSKVLAEVDVPGEVRRLRLAQWRILYAVSEADRIVDVLAVRKRPPYDYGDLASLLENYKGDDHRAEKSEKNDGH